MQRTQHGWTRASPLISVLDGPWAGGVCRQKAGVRRSRADLLVGSVFAIAWLLPPQAVSACSMVCVNKVSGQVLFGRVDAVFIGRVVDVQEGVDAVLQVEEVYRGRVGPSVIVESGWGADCRQSFRKDRRYLLFSAPDTNGRVRSPSACDPPAAIESDPSLVAWIRSHKRLRIRKGPVAPPLSGSPTPR